MENKFVDLKLFSQYLKMNDAEQDALLLLYLNSAQQIIENYIGYSLEAKTYNYGIKRSGYFVLQSANIFDLKINGDAVTVLKQNVNIVFIKENITGEISSIEYTAGFNKDNVPEIIRLTMMRIASLMVSEEGGDIAITGKNFGADGGRTFISTRDYSKILKELDAYRIL